MESDNESLIITEEEAGLRLDQILASRFKNVKSRTYFQNLIDEKNVLVNGIAVKKRTLLNLDDEVEVNFVCTPELSITAENIALDIIYEDEDILLVNKPCGMVVHPAVGNWSGTFVNALLYHCQQLQTSDLRPGIVHRLDKDTSGLLLAAKTTQAHQKLISMFSERKIHKEYLAICLGNPRDVTIDLPIGRHPVHRKKMAVLESGGRNAISICKTLAFNGKLSLVNVILVTGRTHQIRVHLKQHGTPVLGDPVYGNEQSNRKYGFQKQLLHAQYLRFSHPITGKLLEFNAPPPKEMEQLISVLKK